jgi:hypothetical protein
VVEKTVDFESLRANGAPEVKDVFAVQDVFNYYDILNGPVYPELVKDF